MTLLRRGSRGPEVRELQARLGLPVDGVFGPNTHAAVRKFQRAHGLVDDGIVGAKTHAAFGKTPKAGGTTSVAPLHPPGRFGRTLTFELATASATADKYGIDNTGGPEEWRKLHAFAVHVWDRIDELIGWRRGTSFLRMPAVNRHPDVGSSAGSQHEQGEAGDGETVLNEPASEWPEEVAFQLIADSDIDYDMLIIYHRDKPGAPGLHVSHDCDRRQRRLLGRVYADGRMVTGEAARHP